MAGNSAVVGVIHQQPSSRASNTAICPGHITPPAATSRPPQKFPPLLVFFTNNPRKISAVVGVLHQKP